MDRALQLGVDGASEQRVKERTSFTKKGELLAKMIDQHDLAVYISDQ